VEGAVSELSLKDKMGAEIEKRLPGGKVKKKAKAEVVLETSTRSKKKCVTTIQGAASYSTGYSSIHNCGASYLAASRQLQGCGNLSHYNRICIIPGCCGAMRQPLEWCIPQGKVLGGSGVWEGFHDCLLSSSTTYWFS